METIRNLLGAKELHASADVHIQEIASGFVTWRSFRPKQLDSLALLLHQDYCLDAEFTSPQKCTLLVL